MAWWRGKSSSQQSLDRVVLIASSMACGEVGFCFFSFDVI
jgi:hypothetical protein